MLYLIWTNRPIKKEDIEKITDVIQQLKLGNSPNKRGYLNKSKKGVNGFKLFNIDNIPMTDPLSYIIGDKKNNAWSKTGISHWKSLKKTVVNEPIIVKPRENKNNNKKANGRIKIAKFNFIPNQSINGNTTIKKINVSTTNAIATLKGNKILGIKIFLIKPSLFTYVLSDWIIDWLNKFQGTNPANNNKINLSNLIFNKEENTIPNTNKISKGLSKVQK